MCHWHASTSHQHLTILMPPTPPPLRGGVWQRGATFHSGRLNTFVKNTVMNGPVFGPEDRYPTSTPQVRSAPNE